MRGTMKTILVAVFLLVVAVVVLKGWLSYQERYVCEPKVRQAVEKFVDAVRISNYETIESNSMFINKEQFREIKTKISQRYSLEIQGWWSLWGTHLVMTFDNGATYGLSLAPKKSTLHGCWGVEYKVLTIR